MTRRNGSGCGTVRRRRPRSRRRWEAAGRVPAGARAAVHPGTGPRDVDGAESAGASLLLGAPGEQTIDDNRDLFVRRGMVRTISAPIAALALLTMQGSCPGIGRGYRASLRKGGPLVTIVDPRHGVEPAPETAGAFWKLVWMNSETLEMARERSGWASQTSWPMVFPWLGETRTSAPPGEQQVLPAGGHPLQAYFGMPRRIRLELGAAGGCSITGSAAEFTVVGFLARHTGMDSRWVHPLTPYVPAPRRGGQRPATCRDGRTGVLADIGRVPVGGTRWPWQRNSIGGRTIGVRAAKAARVHGVACNGVRCRCWVG
ncbi:MAG: type I-E CRISPR-associated protein Cse1/CasA [Gemmatimonadetes bacterium]|nr:type I-E CRISPR-associated protein Cse1/CasA [Gemmatimonadota bacterium]